MIRIPANHHNVVKLQAKNDPGKALDKALSDRHQLNREDDYYVYQVHSKSQETWRDPPEEYMVVMKRNAYQLLAINMLANLTNAEVENYLIPGAASQHAKYVDKSSDQRQCVERIVKNAELTEGQIQPVTRIASDKSQFELAAALQDVAQQHARHVAQLKRRRSPPPGASRA